MARCSKSGKDDLQSDERVRRVDDGSMMRGVVTGGTATAANVAWASGRRQDRHRQRSHRRLVYRLHADLCDRRLDGLSRKEETAGQRHDRRQRRAADVRRLHEDFLKGQTEGRVSEGARTCRKT
jgi:C4-dicarboxylate-specific signal transduction histidine kinase